MRRTITKGLVAVSAAAGLALMTAGPALAAGPEHSDSTIIGHVEGSARNQHADDRVPAASGGVDIGGALTIEQPDVAEPVAETAPVEVAAAVPTSVAPPAVASHPVASPDLQPPPGSTPPAGLLPPMPDVAPVTTVPPPAVPTATEAQASSSPQAPQLADATSDPAPLYTGADVLAFAVGALMLVTVGVVRRFLRRSYR